MATLSLSGSLKKSQIRCGGQLIDLSTPLVQGILNVTPDSFYADSRTFADREIHLRTEQLLNEGADIIDVGAYSSRPGAAHISEAEELERLGRALRIVREVAPQAILSIDTFRSGIVRSLYDTFGAFIVNDISGGELDTDMPATVAELRLPYILMHMKGNPQTMQQTIHYADVVEEVLAYFAAKLAVTKELGIADVIVDPGFGFGKTLEHNYQLLDRLDELDVLGCPVLAGLSRKSMLYKLLNITPQQALNATTAANTIALMKGASILRVHDVAAAVEVVRIVGKLGGSAAK